MRKLILLVTTMALVAVGAASFAAFESHLIDVRAHTEKATYTTPDDLNFGITIMQQKYDAECLPDGTGTCMKIHLSDSFKEQTTFIDVLYNVYCEDKAPGDPHRTNVYKGQPSDGNITPFIVLRDSDPLDRNDDVVLTKGCGKIDYSTDTATLNPVKWAYGELVKGSDEVDLWDMSFYAPVCRDNYNPETDPIKPDELATRPGGGIIDSKYCHKGPGPDSDEYVNLASNVKFQVMSLSVPTGPTPTPEAIP